MIWRIINWIDNKLLTLAQRSRTIALNRHANVFFDQTFSLGSQSHFNFYGVCKELRIYKNVSTRTFCNFLLFSNARLIIHENVFFNNYCSINCLGSVEIGENTIFGEGVKIYDHNHRYGYDNGRLVVERNDFTIGEIKIGKNCWIGSNVTILNNVEIGDNVIIGADCLIYKSVASNSIVKAQKQT